MIGIIIEMLCFSARGSEMSYSYQLIRAEVTPVLKGVNGDATSKWHIIQPAYLDVKVSTAGSGSLVALLSMADEAI